MTLFDVMIHSVSQIFAAIMFVDDCGTKNPFQNSLSLWRRQNWKPVKILGREINSAAQHKQKSMGSPVCYVTLCDNYLTLCDNMLLNATLCDDNMWRWHTNINLFWHDFNWPTSLLTLVKISISRCQSRINNFIQLHWSNNSHNFKLIKDYIL